MFKANAGLPCYLKAWSGFKHASGAQKKSKDPHVEYSDGGE